LRVPDVLQTSEELADTESVLAGNRARTKKIRGRVAANPDLNGNGLN